MKRVASLSVAIKPSRHLLFIQSAAHGVAAGAVLLATLPPWLAAVLLLLIGASWVQQRRIRPLEALILRGDGRLEIVGVGGTASDAEVHPHSLVLSFLVVLLYRQEGRLRALTLLADSLAAEDFRQVRLWLRWRAAPQAADAA